MGAELCAVLKMNLHICDTAAARVKMHLWFSFMETPVAQVHHKYDLFQTDFQVA